MRRRGEVVVDPRAACGSHRGQLEKLWPPDSVAGPSASNLGAGVGSVLGKFSLLLLHFFSFPVSLCHKDVLRGKDVSYLYLNISLPPYFSS